MTKIVRTLLAVAIVTVVMLMFIVTLILTVPFHLHSSVESERAEVDAAERPLTHLGLSSDLDLSDAKPRWFSDVTVRITPTLGVSFDFLRPYAYTDGYVSYVKVSVDDTLSGEESGSATKHRYSYETGIRMYFSPTLNVGVTYGERYEGDSVTTSLETGFGL